MRFFSGICLLWLGLAVFSANSLSSSTLSSSSLSSNSLQDRARASARVRPIQPWVFRSVLDGQPRMVTVALHKDLYIAFDAANAGLYKVWKGDVELEGAVYTGKHGPQPTAEGYAYYEQKLEEPAWIIEREGEPQQASVRFAGYKFVDGQVLFEYELVDTRGLHILVEERPEYIHTNGLTGLQRRFTTPDLPEGVRLGFNTAFTSLQSATNFSTDGEFTETGRTTIDHGNGKTLRVDGQLWLNSAGSTQATNFYHPDLAKLLANAPKKAEKPDDDSARGKQLVAGSDCQACHNEERKTVGPAYIDIAKRYAKTDANIATLADKIIKGGSGSWGEIPMNPHPDLMPDDAQLIVRYVLSFNKDVDNATAEPDTLFLGVGSHTLQIDEKPKPTGETAKQLKPGLAVAAFHVEDFSSQTFSQAVLSGVAPVVHVHELEHLGPISTNVRLIFNGFLQIEKAGTYELRLITDDGGRMTINGARVVNRWQNQGPTPVDVKVDLRQGLNEIEIDYFQALAGASISLQWRLPGADKLVVIPEKNLRHHQHQVAQPVPYIPRKELIKSIPGDKAPLEGVHPSFTLSSARPEWFKPMVGGMDFFSDGRLALCTWDDEGSVYVLEGVQDRAAEAITVKRVASGLSECLGLKVVNDEIFAMQKHELTHLVDNNDDGAIDEYLTVSDQWRVSANFHEFAFGLEYQDGYFYATLATAIEPGGASTNPQIPDRGKAIKISRKDGTVEFIAHGLRTPNGIGKGVDGEMFIADNQGDWLPSSKIVHLKKGAFYGSRSVDFAGTEGVAETLPLVWLPQDEIGNSPSEPVSINVGDYAGQMLHGEVTHGGLKRVFAEKVNGNYQGALFRFTQGLEAGVNRVAWAPDGKSLFVGGIGNPGNWGQTGKNWFGLEKLQFNGKRTFEMLKVSARSNGMELEFTEALEPGRGITAAEFDVQQWYYQPTAEYGGEKLDLRDLKIASVNLSKDRKKVFLELDGMKPGHVIYLRVADPFLSVSGQSLWTTEAWYTLNAMPARKPGFKNPVKKPADNVLTTEQRKAGWRLLFDGKSTKGWRNYQSDTIGAAWKVDAASLHLDPAEKEGWQTVGGGDIVTEEVYENYELYLEWKLAPGGNSGLIYGVVENDDYQYVWHTGPEYQMLDNPAHPDGVIKTHRAGDLYDFKSSRFVTVNAGGEWNRTRLIVNKGKVEHWLNGYKVIEYDQRLPAWDRMIARSKFKDLPGFGKARKGHIALQDHGDPVWFKNIRIRELK